MRLAALATLLLWGGLQTLRSSISVETAPIFGAEGGAALTPLESPTATSQRTSQEVPA